MPELDFTTIYNEHAPTLLRLCKAYATDDDQAQDLLQETFVKVWQNLDKFRGDAKISTWLYRITINTCLGHLKKEKNKKTGPISLAKEPAANDSFAEKKENLDNLYRAIKGLPESERLIISMVLEDIPYDEIAGALEITEGNLRVKIHRIKQQLTTLFFSYANL